LVDRGGARGGQFAPPAGSEAIVLTQENHMSDRAARTAGGRLRLSG